MQDSADKTARERIFKAAAELIDGGGLEELTVRDIAGRAGVNVGAINYYFGSKDELLMLVGKQMMRQTMDSFSMLDDRELPPLERLESFLVYTVKQMMFRHHFFKRQMFRNARAFSDKREMMNYFREIGIEKITLTLIEIEPSLDERHATLLALQLFSAAITPNMFLRHASTSETSSFTVEEQIRSLLARIFR